MTANHVLQKALLLLDRGSAKRGEEELRRAISDAESESDLATLTTAACALGDLLVELGRFDEAKPALEQAVATGTATRQHHEVRRARELLSRIGQARDPIK